MPRRKYPLPVPEGQVTIAQGAKLLDMSTASFFRYATEADFPKPVQPGAGMRPALYSRAELLAWKAKRGR